MRIVISPLRILFNDFIEEKRYLENLSETTIRSYTLAFKWFEPYGFDTLTDFVIALRKARLNAGGCNVKIRSINSFLAWCHRNGHCQDLKIKPLKHTPVVPYQLTDTHVRQLITYKPKGRIEKRLHAIVLLCLDTGIRIDEALTLRRKNVDLDNLLITVVGKGNKERIIPFSLQYRKTLFPLIRGNDFEFVFSTRQGLRLGYHNVRRDLKALTEKLGINCGFHDFRRYFITSAIKNGMNPVIVQRIVGHSSFAVTQRYIYLVTDDLSLAHAQTSVLNRLR